MIREKNVSTEFKMHKNMKRCYENESIFMTCTSIIKFALISISSIIIMNDLIKLNINYEQVIHTCTLGFWD